MSGQRLLYLFVVPSLKPTGGNLELIRLARSVVASGPDAKLVALWEAEAAVSCDDLRSQALSRSVISPKSVLKEILSVCIRFWRMMREEKPQAVILTHYITYFLAIFVPRRNRWFFVQDTEWTFVSSPFVRKVLRYFILSQLRRGRVLTANSYLTSEMERAGVEVTGQVSIWASADYAGDATRDRDIDLVVMLRRGAHKRADLTEALLEAAIEPYRGLRVALITPNDEFSEKWTGRGIAEILLRPSLQEMRSLYERSLTYVLLSDHEGFGLPPLEAMGAGVVPICRPAGGVEAYMRDELHENVITAEAAVEDILAIVEALKQDRTVWQRKSAAAQRIFHEGLVTPARRKRDLHEAKFV